MNKPCKNMFFNPARHGYDYPVGKPLCSYTDCPLKCIYMGEDVSISDWKKQCDYPIKMQDGKLVLTGEPEIDFKEESE